MQSSRALDSLLIDRIGDGEFSVHRDLMRDADIFDLEMRHIFGGTWMFLGLDSQAPRPHDYFTTWIGTHPVVVSRDAGGTLHAFLNTCRHRGVRVLQHAEGNARHHVCPYHGWAYDSAGRNINIKDQEDGCYSASFERENHDLVPLARFSEYRGILFGSLNPDVHSLEDHLGETRYFLDLILDQSTEGIELVPGATVYRFKANWKVQVENGLDAYHLTSTHPSFMKIVQRRASGESGNRLRAVDFSQQRVRGGFTFDYGHALVWSKNPTPEIRPLYSVIDRVRERVGDLRAQWMLNTRNLVLFPNVQFADNASMQLRVIRPLAVDLTEMKSYCLAPAGEAAAAREFRLRQFEDFYNSTGLATPDDTACYEASQVGNGARTVQWQQGFARGITSAHDGANDIARTLGVHPRTSQVGAHEVQDETALHAAYREWRRLMLAGEARDARAPAPAAGAAAGRAA